MNLDQSSSRSPTRGGTYVGLFAIALGAVGFAVKGAERIAIISVMEASGLITLVSYYFLNKRLKRHSRAEPVSRDSASPPERVQFGASAQEQVNNLTPRGMEVFSNYAGCFGKMLIGGLCISVLGVPIGLLVSSNPGTRAGLIFGIVGSGLFIAWFGYLIRGRFRAAIAVANSKHNESSSNDTGA